MGIHACLGDEGYNGGVGKKGMMELVVMKSFICPRKVASIKVKYASCDGGREEDEVVVWEMRINY